MKSSPATPSAGSHLDHILMVYPAPLPRLEYLSFDHQQAIVPNPLPRPTLLNLWASWCQPCIAELKELSSRKDELDAAGIDVLALAVDGLGADKPSEPETARQLLSDLRFPFAAGRASEVLVDRLQMVHDVLFDFHGPLPLPTSLLLDTQRQLVALYKGRKRPYRQR